MTNPSLENLLREDRTFPPPEAFRANALASDEAIYDEADKDPEAWWAGHAERLRWTKPWDHVLEWDAPFAKWFTGGQLNIADNCLDRHVEQRARRQGRLPRGGRAGRHPQRHLRRPAHTEAGASPTCSSRGRGQGDRVCIYLPKIPELPIAMIACARIGADPLRRVRGFSAQSLIDRIDDADATGRDHSRRQLPRQAPSR